MKIGTLILVLAAALLSDQLSAENAEALPALVQLLDQTDDAQFQLDILKGMSDGLKGRRSVKMPPGWEEVSAKLDKSPNPHVRALAQALSLTFGSAAALNSLRQTLLDRGADLNARTSALDSLLQVRDPTLAPALQGLLNDPVMRAGALRGLAAFEDLKTPQAVLGAYGSLSDSEKKQALHTLASRATFAGPLLAAVAGKSIPVSHLTADLVRQLRNLNDPEVSRQVEKLWGVARESEADKLKEIAKYKAMIQSGPPGEAARGRAVFDRICQQCHTLFGEGGKVGPDLTGSNRGDLDYILQNALDPNAVIPNDYRTSTLETKDDRVITGIVTRQDENAITIVTASDTLLVPRQDVHSLRQGEISMMPEGLLQALSETEVRDLIAYLKSPAQISLKATAQP